MPKIYECQTARSNITQLKALNENILAFSTSQNGITLIDSQECDTKRHITNKRLNSSSTHISFSPNSEMFTFVNQRTIYVVDMQSKETIQTINIDNEDVDILSFDSSSTYIIVGTKNGRVLQYRFDKSSLLSRLCSFPHDRESIYTQFKDNENFVSAFAFCENKFACSGYGGAIFIIDLYIQSNRDVITHNRTRVDALCFINSSTLLCGNKNGTIDVISLDNTSEYKSIQTPLSTIKQIIVMPNPDYILIVGITNVISIIDIKNAKIVHAKYAEFKANITKIELINSESIIVALENKKILHLELPSVEKLKSLILHNSIEQAYKLVYDEPMLQGSLEHKTLEETFEKKYALATDALINQNKKEALNILAIYENVKCKETKVKELFTAFANFRRFHGIFLEKKYALAYAMASKFEPLKQTVQYRQMEQVFKLAFANAQRQVLQGNIPGAKALLSEYLPVISKKPIIQLILTQNEEFVEFLKAINKKDYNLINSLVHENKLFAQIPTYITLNEEIDNKLQNIRFSIKSGEIVIAKKLLFSLKDVLHVKDEVEKLNLECKHALVLRRAYKENHFKSCYEILDTHKSLKSTELGILLEKHWSKIISQCEQYALEGNIKDIKKTLGKLLTLTSRENKIGDLIRVSFQVRIKMLIKSKNFRGAETIIYTYTDIFGLDSEIKYIMKAYEKNSSTQLALSNELDERPSRNSWVHSSVIMKQESL